MLLLGLVNSGSVPASHACHVESCWPWWPPIRMQPPTPTHLFKSTSRRQGVASCVPMNSAVLVCQRSIGPGGVSHPQNAMLFNIAVVVKACCLSFTTTCYAFSKRARAFQPILQPLTTDTAMNKAAQVIQLLAPIICCAELCSHRGCTESCIKN